MDPLNGFLQRMDGKQKFAYALVRIFLGVALFARGVILISEPGSIANLDPAAKMNIFYTYVIITHLLGGFLLAVGLGTRIGALLQIPTLVAAVFLMHKENGLLISGQSLEVAALVLFLLVIFLIFGSGTLALNNYFRLKI